LAAEHGVSPKTVRNDATYATAVDKVNEAVPGARDAILSGKLKATRRDVTKLEDR